MGIIIIPPDNNNIMMEFTKEQKYIIQKFEKGENLFISGPGGTGKTELIKYIQSMGYKGLQICALTGCAALLLKCGARTIHSWSGIKRANGKIRDIVYSVTHSSYTKSQWKKTKILIIDEVSMMSQKIFELLDAIGKAIKQVDKPFGGIQVIFVGDFYQLPPVGSLDDETTSKFCFESNLWNKTFQKENQIQLSHIFRQNDPIYKSILMEIRSGNISDNSIEILNSKVSNAVVHDCTKIFPKKKDVERVNQEYYNTLDGTQSYTYNTKVSYDNDMHIENNTPINSYLLKQYQKYTQVQKDIETNVLLNNVPIEHMIHLRKGTRVMCCVNLDMEKGICNGSQGIVLDFQEKDGKYYPIVKYDNGIVETMFEYTWQSESCPTICIRQVPLMWAWAITIHKIQGATLDSAQIDIGKQVFESGQTYVALSRIKSLKGLHITSFDPQTIFANKKVIDFYNQLLDITFETHTRVPENNKTVKKNTKVVIQDSANNSRITQFFNVKKI